MILKKTITASGSQVQDTAAALNEVLKDYLISTGLFRLASVESGYGERPKYTIKYRDADYALTLQSYSSSSSIYPRIVLGITCGSGEAAISEKSVSFGTTANAQITIHLVTHGESFAFKLFQANGTVGVGGSCLRWTRFSGERGYLYQMPEYLSLLGYMGRYRDDAGAVCQITYEEYPYTQYAVIQEQPVVMSESAAVGYADDIITVSVPQPGDSDSFSLYQLQGSDYHGGRLTYGSPSYSVSSCAAIAMKSG